MRINSKFLFLILFILCSLASNAGDLKPKVTWGPEYFAPKRHFPIAFLGNLNSGFIQISHQPGKTLTIQLFTGGAGGLNHLRPEFQISGGRKFLTNPYIELTHYKSILKALLDSFMNFINMVLNPLRP